MKEADNKAQTARHYIGVPVYASADDMAADNRISDPDGLRDGQQLHFTFIKKNPQTGTVRHHMNSWQLEVGADAAPLEFFKRDKNFWVIVVMSWMV